MVNARYTRRSFTLVELLVAVGIIVALTILSVPMFRPLMSARSVDSAARVLKAALLRARITAVAEGEEAYCWVAPGSVYESGLTQAGSTSGGDFTVYINDKNSEWQTQDGVSFRCEFSGSGWQEVAKSDAYGGEIHKVNGGGSGANVVRWYFKFDSPATAKVYARWRDYTNRTTVTYKVKHTDGVYDAAVDQRQPGDSGGPNWNLLRSEDFSFGSATEYYVELDDTYGTSSNKIVTDAIKLVGSLETYNPDTECLVAGKNWTPNVWAGHYVVISNISPSGAVGQPIVARIESNEAAKLTVSSWQPNNPPPNCQLLIVSEDPRAVTRARAFTVGSGTSTSAQWTSLPDDVEVCAEDAVSGTRLVFPIIFTRTGRARFANDSSDDFITIKLRDRERPDDPDLWRFVRVYRNTGHAAMARRLQDLP